MIEPGHPGFTIPGPRDVDDKLSAQRAKAVMKHAPSLGLAFEIVFENEAWFLPFEIFRFH